MKIFFKSALIIVSSLFLQSKASAFISPLSVSIIPPIEFPPADFSITGVRISAIYGRHRDIYGIDLGLIGNITEQTFTGVGVSGVFNLTHGTTTILGLQFAGLTNINTKEISVYGIQATLGLNQNDAASKVVGIEFAGIANLCAFTKIYGAQIGIYNHALEVYGLQIGVVNSTKNLHGVQIGLLNFNESGPFIVSPLLNIGF
jgi:hypothetical protein